MLTVAVFVVVPAPGAAEVPPERVHRLGTYWYSVKNSVDGFLGRTPPPPPDTPWYGTV